MQSEITLFWASKSHCEIFSGHSHYEINLPFAYLQITKGSWSTSRPFQVKWRMMRMHSDVKQANCTFPYSALQNEIH